MLNIGTVLKLISRAYVLLTLALENGLFNVIASYCRPLLDTRPPFITLAIMAISRVRFVIFDGTW